MSSNDRFYQLDFRHRSVLKGDIGSLLKIDGLVVGGSGAQAILMLPTSDIHPEPVTHRLSCDEWDEYIQRSDVPELMNYEKVFHRKARYEISGFVQQRTWVADGLKCMYCGGKMGEVQMTIDHFIPIELGGVNNDSNYLSCCRRCNKDKGSEDPREFCKRNKLDYDALVKYLADRKIKK